MTREKLQTALFFIVSAVFIYLFYQLIIPFFAPICWAAVFAIIFYPIYERLRKKIKSPGLCSLVMCILILILIIGPIAYLLGALVGEAITAATKINAWVKSGELKEQISITLPWIEAIKVKLSEYYDISNIQTDQMIKQAIENVSSVILNQSSWVVSNISRILFYFVLMIFTLYYFFKDGERIIQKMKRVLPLNKIQIDATFKQLKEVIQATMYGSVTVAIVQGTLGGIMFAIFGLPSAVFWGAIMAFLSIVPFLGAFVIFVPAGIILIFSGSIGSGLAIILIGTLVISQVDNLLRPFLISGKTELHPLLLFFTILGGIYLFGLLGAVLGPLIGAVFVTLLNIFEFRLHPQEENSLLE